MKPSIHKELLLCQIVLLRAGEGCRRLVGIDGYGSEKMDIVLLYRNDPGL